ncbi:DNA/RNA non-specific endonuclease [Chitinophaga sp. Ak27]|uniref:DNA/RNA non-specific endonuclease n=1 Tax=Chitinophaga sp. Ak27 TaxID=2726116 RepID=UPI00145C60C7|nr:DNA/RNA non-specific endonuclease [Chitinophaga sp. Ak27]NLU90939.1 DNA/RNA non-specific endonuclease [Chitinophaga sp. Ak27]
MAASETLRAFRLLLFSIFAGVRYHSMPKKRKKQKKQKTQRKNQGLSSILIIVILILAAFAVTTCSRRIPGDPGKPVHTAKKKSHRKKNNKSATHTVPLLAEDFEAGNKTNYNNGVVTLSSGPWKFKDAVTGALDEDHKTGSQALRIRDNGMAGMNFDIAVNGTVTVSLKYALYGADESGSWELWASVNRGQSYVRIGVPVTVTATTLRSAVFTAATSTGTIRFDIRKTDKGSSRINFDVFRVTAGGQLTPDAKPVSTVSGDDDNMLLGNPSGATSSLVMANNYLMDKGYYKLSYNRDRGTPNWVCWHVSRKDLGPMSRANDFRPDADLPVDWYQVTQSSYMGSGFDRGHNCPSGDRTASREANEATFLMTNMIPQAPNHNQHLWKNLEDYTRELVMDGNEVYVIMGSYGSGGVGSKGLTKSIDHSNIVVPDHIWKILVILPEGNNDLQRINKHTRIIAVNTPNKNEVNTRWSAYLTTVDDIERVTHYKLLDKIPVAARQELIKKIDTGE